MFEIKHIKGNTYYYEAFTNVGIYKLNETEAILIDGCDHKRMAKGLSKQLRAMGLKVKMIINTHCHFDHICGNSYFSGEYGCKILSTKKEQPFIAYPSLESEFYYSGINTDKERNPFFTNEPSETEIISEHNIPDGFEIIPLPGHSFEMVGVRTPDNVLFLADAILSKPTWDEYKLPFFYNVNESLRTMEKTKETKADYYLPSHTGLVEDINELADYNIEKLTEKKELVYSLCEGKGFDDLFKAIMESEKLRIRTEKYPSYAVMVRNLLQSLVEDDRIYGALEENIFVYHRK